MAERARLQSVLPAMVRHLVIVLGDQLDAQSSALQGFDATQDVVWMAEVAKSPPMSGRPSSALRCS